MSDIIDAEIILTETEAHEITSRIRAWVNAFPADDIAAAYTRRIWVTLGYDDWEEYLDSEFDIAGRLRLPAPERAEVVNELADAGMSNRAIAASLGVDEKTVRNDKAGAEKSAPDVTGRDGKTYKPKPKVVNIDGTPILHPNHPRPNRRSASRRTSATPMCPHLRVPSKSMSGTTLGRPTPQRDSY